MLSIATSVHMISPATRIAGSVSLFHSAEFKASSSSSLLPFVNLPFTKESIRRGRRIFSEVNVRSQTEASSSVSAVSSATTASLLETETDEEIPAKIGARVRVTVPLKVYHVPKLPEVDLTGMEGVLKNYVCIWKGKRISANLPYKVEFFANVEGRPPIKFFAHLKEDEFEYI